MLQLDLQAFLPHSLLSILGEEFIESVLDDVASMARAKWIRLAQTELTSSKRDYIDGIQQVEGEGMERMVTLLGVLPNMIEQGTPPFDMRTTLLGEGKGKVSASGKRYRAIPFRHGSPGSKGQAGAPMGSQYGPRGAASRAIDGGMSQLQSVQLGKAIYDQAKKLRRGRRLPVRTSVTMPDTTRVIQRGNQRPVVQVHGKTITVPKLAEHHSTDIFAGMQRTSKKYKTGSGAQYTTFRTISDANPQGWIHPGIQGRNLHREVERNLDQYMGRIINTALKRALAPMAGDR